MILVMDTDTVSLLERANAEALPLQMRLERVLESEVFTTVVTYEEQMRGWLSRVAQADTTEKLVIAYSRLIVHLETFRNLSVLPFDAESASQFAQLRKSGVRIGTMDLRIASIALTHDALIITRNLSDFNKVPGLRCEDWSVLI